MICGQGLIDWMILAKEEDKNEHHSAFIAAACAKPLASVKLNVVPHLMHTFPTTSIPTSKLHRIDHESRIKAAIIDLES